MQVRAVDNQNEPDADITPSELKARMDGGGAPVLLDVREPFEREIADLPDAGQKRIPVRELATRIDELDPGAEIVVYCRSGGRSGWAVGLLREHGFEAVRNLKGGILGWREEVDPSLPEY